MLVSSVATCRRLFFFFFNDTATTEIYTLSLHDALPIWGALAVGRADWRLQQKAGGVGSAIQARREHMHDVRPWIVARSEEHTSELQSQSNLVCRLLLEKKKKKEYHTHEYQKRRATVRGY